MNNEGSVEPDLATELLDRATAANDATELLQCFRHRIVCARAPLEDVLRHLDLT